MDISKKAIHATTAGVMFCLLLWVWRGAWGAVTDTYVLPVVQEVGLPPLLFLCWNLVLALIPLALALWMRELQGWWFWLVGTMWLLFLPNAPYLLTDLIHLRHRTPVPLWYDALLFAGFAMMGLVAGAYSIALVIRRVAAFYAPKVAQGLGVLVIGLSGFGVYLGRIYRWNSWDVFIRPGALLEDFASLFTHTEALSQAMVFSFCVAALFMLAYYIVSPIQNNPE